MEIEEFHAAIKAAHADRLTNKQAADYIGVGEHTLEVWRCTKRYVIPFTKIGNKIFYRRSDLDAFLASRVVKG